MPEINRLDLWNVYYEAKSQPDTVDILVKFVEGKLRARNSTPEWESKVKEILRVFLKKCNKSYKSHAVSYHNNIFLERNKVWLSSCETFPELTTVSSQPSTSKTGRPKDSNFQDLGESSKRKRTKSLRDEKQADELAFAARAKLQQEGKKSVAKVMKKVAESSPRTFNMIFTAVEKIKRTESGNLDDGYPKNFSEAEAVVHQIECNLTKDQYILNRKRLIDKNCKIFPSYEKIKAYKKNCVPNNMHITEQKAYVSLQDLLNHTASRILVAQEEVLKSGNVVEGCLELVSKIGFDSAGNQSRYNQVWSEIGADDSSIVLTALVPLLLHQRVNDEGMVNILWMNRKPSSTVYCRPLELEFAKETKDFIKIKAEELSDAMNNLEVALVEVCGNLYQVQHRILLTMIDGKVASGITDTGAASCNVCKATPSKMNDIDGVLKREVSGSALQLGLSVLHLHIRFLEYFLNIAKRLTVAEKCYGRYTQEETSKMEARHKNICKRLKNELGLILDQPTSKGGNTNTGNNARRFFEHATKIAEITGLDLDILKKCRVVLKTISCGYAIDTKIFHQYCVQLARELVHKDKYKFWCMPSSIHVALIHGAAIIEALPVPIGMVSEEPLEASHKIVRYLRLHRTRKNSRKATMTDLFNALQIQSDPVIASLRRPAKPKGSLDQEVVSMLLSGSRDQPI